MLSSDRVRRISVALAAMLVLIALSAGNALAGSQVVDTLGTGFAQNAEKAKIQALSLQLQSTLIPAPQSCTSAPPLFCGSTQTSSPSCLSGTYYLDLWTFTGQAGQTLTVRGSTTTSYSILVAIQSYETGAILASNYGAPSTTVSYTFPLTDTYFIGVGFVATYATGPYTLQLTCNSSTPPPSSNCSQTSKTMCLSGGRFAVSAVWRTSDGKTGDGTAVKLTDDSGYFWFFGSSNVEAIVKVLNGCGIGGHYWVFAGGLTNVNVVLTVVDTKTGSVKTYTNPMNAAFQPIQDTGAFSTCP